MPRINRISWRSSDEWKAAAAKDGGKPQRLQGPGREAGGEGACGGQDGLAMRTGLWVGRRGGVVNLEPGFPEGTLRGLRARGHQAGYVVGGYGGYQAILIDEKHGVLHGATEPRKDGSAVGY